ncbi:MAG: hypothetical protein LBC40_07275, partial [Dysgonamonadaceae bacterium]|nr:hypothetical protein [Dysgonamonadaceae bacterium]
DGKLQYLLNDGVKTTILTAQENIPVGKSSIRIEYNDKTVSLSVNGKKAAQADIEAGGRYLNSIAGEGISVGKDLNSPVSKTYPAKFPFSGRVRKITIEQNIN